MYRIVLIMASLSLLIGFGNHTLAEAETDQIDMSDSVIILETSLGNITMEFFYDDAPNHVANFIKLSQSGFYDGTIFHRIIPGFMIQGGDPNTVDGDPSTWGSGGPEESVDAEFNTIKHNRGIVSMARSADPNSAGSQFFIVHANSNFLDGQYTAFGRIITEESFETLDKIAMTETGARDVPIDPEQVKIIKTVITSRSDASNIIDLAEPERIPSSIVPPTGNQKFESAELGISFSAPEGWLLQQPKDTNPNSPDIVAVGPKSGVINPFISITVQQTNQKTFDDIVSKKIETLKQLAESRDQNIISQEKTTINGNQAYVIDAQEHISFDDESINIKFKEIIIYDVENFYTVSYGNGIEDFDSQLSKFEETIDSFEILSSDISTDEETNDAKDEKEELKEGDTMMTGNNIKAASGEDGGCLIATATYGSELAPQVQQLRELRDNIILPTESGNAFMSGFNQFYYSFSPAIADLERESPIFKEIIKISLTPMLSSLSLLHHVDIDSEQEMLGYGISLIILNLGMYIAAPAIIIYKLKQTYIQKIQ